MSTRRARFGTTLILVIRKEAMDLVRDRRAGSMALALTAVLAIATTTGWWQQAQHTRARVDAEVSQRRQWLERRVANAHIAAHQGVVVFRSSSSLASADPGINDFAGGVVFLEAHRSNDVALASALDDEWVPVAGLDLAAVMQVLVPLLLVSLTYGGIAAERDAGTWRALWVTGVRARTLIIGKAIVAILPAALALGLVAVVLSGVLVAARASGDQWARLGIWLAAYATYSAIWVAIGLVISTVASTARRSVVVALVCWCVACVWVPRAGAQMTARWLTPPLADLTRFDDAAARAHAYSEQYRARIKQLEADLMATHGVARAADLPVSVSAMMLALSEEEDTKAQRARATERFDGLARQDRWLQWLAVTSPLLAVQTVSMAMSGTDARHLRHFTEAAETYRYATVQALNDDLIHHPYRTAREGADAYRTRERALYERMAPFVYDPPTWKSALNYARISVGMLVGWFVAAMTAVWWVASRVRG